MKKTTGCCLLAVLSIAPGRLAAADDQPFADAIANHGLDAPAGDGRRTLGRFGTNLGRNLIGVFKPDTLKPLAFGAALAGGSALLDGATHNFFGPVPRAPQLGNAGQSVGGVAVMGPAVLLAFAAGRGSHDTRFRAATYDMAQAMIVTQVYTTGLKYAVSRARPDGSDNLSFPSGHTSNAFALATVASHHYGMRVGVLSYAAASLVGVSRLEKNAHHLSDVVAGAALGYAVGRTVVREDGEAVSRKPRLDLMPMTDASGHGFGIGASVSF